MVKTNNHYVFSPAVFAALTLAIIIYTGIVPIKRRNTFSSVLLHESIQILGGSIDSNPVKTSSGNYYSVQLQATYAKSKNISSQANGHVQALIPTEIIEALYPGKLYSKVYNSITKHSPLIEKGLIVELHGSFIYSSAENVNETPIFVTTHIYDYGWVNAIAKYRSFFRLEFKRLLYAWGDAGGLLVALLSGSREYTNKDISDGFKSAGLSHILALSGMHLSVFAGIAFTGGKFFLGKKAATVWSLIAVIIFVWFAGLSPSLFRALLCTLISLLLQFCALPGVSGTSEVVYRFISPAFSSIRLLRMLSVSFLIHTVLFPNDVFSAAFMLSYGALLGIVLSDYFIKPLIVRYIPTTIASALSASIGAQLCTAPVTLSLFGTLIPIGIISSVVVSPLALGYLVCGFFCILICMCIPFLLYPIGDIIQSMYRFLETIVMWFSHFPSIHL